LQITERLVRHCVVLDIVDNRFEAAKTAQLKKHAMAFLEQGYNNMVLNLSQVDYLDSFGLATVISLLKECRTRHGDLALYGLNDTARRLIVVTRLDKVLTAWDTEAEAIDALVGDQMPIVEEAVS
jgi:anti-sigma B factor antagonist